jgi:arsenite methyltransferase
MAQDFFLDEPMLDVIEQWRYYFSVLAPGAGDLILDVGSRCGDAERLLVKDYPDIERVVGLEYALDRSRKAKDRCLTDGRPGQIVFQVGDAQSLPYDDNTFDKVFCVEALENVADPLKVLAEIKRVLKPGGVAVIEHSDFYTQTFHSSYKEMSLEIIRTYGDIGRNGQIGREVYGLCNQAGFSSADIKIYTLINTQWRPDVYAYRIAHLMAQWLMDKSLTWKPRIETWLQDLESLAEQNRFFYSINRYVCLCVK